jgi:hypothetical protein
MGTGLAALVKLVFVELIFIQLSFLPAIHRHSRIPPEMSKVSPEFVHAAFSWGVVV